MCLFFGIVILQSVSVVISFHLNPPTHQLLLSHATGAHLAWTASTDSDHFIGTLPSFPPSLHPLTPCPRGAAPTHTDTHRQAQPGSRHPVQPVWSSSLLGEGRRSKRWALVHHWDATSTPGPLPFPANLHIFQTSCFCFPLSRVLEQPRFFHTTVREYGSHIKISCSNPFVGWCWMWCASEPLWFSFFLLLSREESQHQGRGTLQKHVEMPESEGAVGEDEWGGGDEGGPLGHRSRSRCDTQTGRKAPARSKEQDLSCLSRRSQS